jgi:hypothetical protein
MIDIHGYVIVNKETGERWGQVFNSIGGAKSSYNSNERQKHLYREDYVLFTDQTEYVIKPLIIWEQ